VIKHLCCDTPSRRIHIGWISLQPDGTISFGLSDPSYISPKFKGEFMLWNAHNRVGIEYIVASDPSALEQVRNPHFTYHPATIMFHLKDNGPVKKALFRGIADVNITLEQQQTMPWIRAISAPLSELQSGGRRQNNIPTEELTIKAPSESVSAWVALDFIKKEDAKEHPDGSQWDISWHNTTIWVCLSTCPAQIATLSWFHSF
jgi:hypothetical protein